MTLMKNYDLRYETRECRCAWCWEAIDDRDSHTVVSSLRSPYLELRFHHACWRIYRGCSGIEGRELDALYREWSPQRVETLRLHAGLNTKEMASKLHVPTDTLIAFLSGQGTLGQRPFSRLRQLAIDTKFERQEEGAIDWSDRRACFCLCMHCGWNARELAARLGVRYSTVTAWWDKGVPKQSVRHWNQLNALARQYKFDASMLFDDHLWTPEFLQDAIAQSGRSQAEWARAGGSHSSFFLRTGLTGVTRMNRRVAYHLTKAAIRLNASLPPKACIGPLRRTPRPFPYGLKGPQGARIWKEEELALLGTMPDRVVSEKLGNRSYVAVRCMRRKLGLKGMPKGHWAGTPQQASLPLEEVLARYGKHLRGERIQENVIACPAESPTDKRAAEETVSITHSSSDADALLPSLQPGLAATANEPGTS
jgi:hypothetical protein